MKKLIITLLLITSLLFQIEFTFANWSTPVKVRTTEKIPWVKCDPVTYDSWTNSWKIVPNLYDCNVDKWATQIVKMLWDIIKYFTYIAALAWVLFIVYNGILYSMWWLDQSLKDDAKKRIWATLIWLVLLLLSWPILQMIAPWIYK